MTYRVEFKSFTSGQISTNDVVGEALAGRSNLEIYMSGLKECSDFIPLPQGAIYSRPGFERIARNDGSIRCVEFVFNESQYYLFVFKHLALDVYNAADDTLVASGIVTPWTSAQLAKMKTLQSRDTFIGFHEDVPVTKIVRSGSHSSWTVSTISFTAPPQFDFGSGAEDAWSATRGYPLTGAFHDNRLIVGGSKSLPETVWGSRAGGLFDFTTGPDEDHAFTYNLNANAVNKVQHIASLRGEMIVNTSMGEWTEVSDYISAQSVAFKYRTGHGMLDTGIRGLNVDSASLFVDRQNRLRSFGYDENSQTYFARNLSVLAPGLLKNPTSCAYARGFVNSANLAVFRNEDGTLAAICLDGEQQVRGWCTITLGAGSVRDICAVNDQIYALIDYNGHTYVTKLTTERHLDLWSTATSPSPTTAWAGFTDFAGQNVSVFGNGMWFENVAVTPAGEFVLDQAVTEVTVGISYIARAETMPIAPIINGQLMRGKRIRKVLVDLILRNTKDIWIDGRRVELRKLGTQLLDAPPPEVDSMITVRLSGIGPEPTVVFESRAPLPTMICSAIVEIRMPPPSG